jgi:hypothetical protein
MFIMQPVNDCDLIWSWSPSLTHMVDEATRIAFVPGIVHILKGSSRNP